MWTKYLYGKKYHKKKTIVAKLARVHIKMLNDYPCDGLVKFAANC